MRAHVGDQLVVDQDRIGIVVGVPTVDGSPPYIIRWLRDGHIAMVMPDQYARIVPAGEPVTPAGAPPGSARPAPGPASGEVRS